jgi:hypothetical protein
MTDSSLHKYRCKIRDKELRLAGAPPEEKDLDPDNPDGDPRMKRLAQAVRNLEQCRRHAENYGIGSARFIKLYGEKK